MAADTVCAFAFTGFFLTAIAWSGICDLPGCRARTEGCVGCGQWGVDGVTGEPDIGSTVKEGRGLMRDDGGAVDCGQKVGDGWGNVICG